MKLAYNLLYVDDGQDGPTWYRNINIKRKTVDKFSIGNFKWAGVDLTPARVRLFTTAIKRQNDPKHVHDWTRATRNTFGCRTCGLVEASNTVVSNPIPVATVATQSK